MKAFDIPAIVTGGSSGLGAASARALAALGAKVTLFDIDETKGIPLAQDIGGLFVNVDVAAEDQIIDGFNTAQNAHGVARILVNCAGVAPGVPMIRYDKEPHPLDIFDYVLRINLTSNFLMAAQFTHRIVQHEYPDEERGVIINTSSVAAFDGHEGHVAYAASKGGLVSMTLPMARDLARYQIRVMTIAPGLFDTPMLDDIPRRHDIPMATQVPFPRRLGDPDEFANLVLAVIDNPMLNGEVIRLDGALRMMPNSLYR